MEIVHKDRNMCVSSHLPDNPVKHVVLVENKRHPLSYRSNTQGEMLENMREFVEERTGGGELALTIVSLSDSYVSLLDAETLCKRIETIAKKVLPNQEDSDIGIIIVSKDISGKLGNKPMQHINVVLPDSKSHPLSGLSLPIETSIAWVLSLDTYIWLPSDNSPGKDVATQMSGFIIRAMENVIRRSTEGSIRDKMNDYHTGKLGKLVMVDDKGKFSKFMKAMTTAKFLSIDTECTSLRRINNTVLTIQVLTFNPKTNKTGLWVLPISHEETPWSSKELRYILKVLRKFFQKTCEGQVHVYQNVSFDVHQLMSLLSLEFYAAEVYDTQAGAFSLEENSKFLSNYNISAYSLEQLETTMGYTRPKDLVIEKSDRSNMASFSLEEIAEYGIIDVLTPFYIMQQQVNIARNRGYKGFFKLVTKQLGAMILGMTEMEHRGIPIDADYLESIASPMGSLADDIRNVAATINDLPGPKKANDYLLKHHSSFESQGLFGEVKKPQMWDIRKNEHLQLLFFSILGLEPLSIRGEGDGAVDAPFQKKYRHTIEVANFTIYQKLTKLKSSFADAIHKFIQTHPDMKEDKRLRPSFGYLGVLTGRSCFAGDTLIETNDGSTALNITNVPIKDIRPGDKVWSVNTTNMTREVKEVTASWEVGLRHVVEVSFSHISAELNSTITYHTVVCTDDHNFLQTDGKWVEAKKLGANTELVHSFGPGTLKIISVRPTPQQVKVYDLTVVDNNNFFAGQLSVHNSTKSPSTQQIPNHGKYAKIIKKQFATDKSKGLILVKADFSAHEVRVSGNLSNDPAILKVVNILNDATLKYRLAGNNLLEKARKKLGESDIHVLNYFIFFGIKIKKKDPRRQDAKAAVFSVTYGSKEKSVASKMLGEKLTEVEDSILALETELREAA